MGWFAARHRRAASVGNGSKVEDLLIVNAKALWQFLARSVGSPIHDAVEEARGGPDGPVHKEVEANPALKADRDRNTIRIGSHTTVVGEIHGTGNVIKIADTGRTQRLHLTIHGNNNKVSIGPGSVTQGLRIEVGSARWKCSRARLTIGAGFSIGSKGRFVIPNSGSVVEIGEECMFSNSVTLRSGEYPHLIFDVEGGEYLDVSDGIFIGNHAWIGEGSFIGKAATVPDECIVGARSVVTRRFTEANCVIAGNPAGVVKKGVQWVSNEIVLGLTRPDWRKTLAGTQLGRINKSERKVD